MTAPEAVPEVPDGGLSLDQLGAMLDDAAGRTHAANTVSTYETSWRVFTEWCTTHGLSPLPATARTLGLFAAHLASLGRSPSTITTRTSAIRTVHRRPELVGLPVPAVPHAVPEATEVDKILRVHRRSLARQGWAPKQAEALLWTDLGKIKKAMDFSRPIAVRDWAILTLGFAMGGRGGELECLNIDDVALDPDDPAWMWVRLCMSKTDQAAEGTMIAIPRADDHALCPVRAVLDWLAWLRLHKVTTGPLLRAMSSGGDKLHIHGMAQTPEALAGRLTREGISMVFSRRSLAAKIPNIKGRIKRLTSHSGRRGAATEAAAAGASEVELCDHLRWQRGSAMASHYVQRASQKENHPIARVMQNRQRDTARSG